MASPFLDIQRVFYGMLEVLESTGTPVQYENQEYTPTNQQQFIRGTIIPASTEVATLGTNGEDEHLGLFVLDVFTTAGKGANEAVFVADVVANSYPAGYSATVNSTIVQFISVNRSVGSIVDGFYKMSVIIRYRARAFRP